MNQFDQAAAVYEEFSRGPFRMGLEFPSVLGALGDMHGLRVLDMGCGSGVYSRALARGGASEVVGLDESDGMLADARSRESPDPLGVNYVAGSLPAGLRGTFDVVLGVYVMPYAATYQELLALCRTAAGALRPGGRFVTLPIHPRVHPDAGHYVRYGFRLRVLRPLSDGSPIGLELFSANRDVHITAHYWSAATLDKALHEAGFGPVRRQPHRLSAEAAARPGDYWGPYLSSPHAAILDTRKEDANR
jgi:toxoflavin synthase